MIRDNSQNENVVTVFGPVSLTDDNTPAAIEVRNAASNTLLLAVGIGGITFTTNNKVEFKITHADASDGDYTAVEAKDVILGPGCDTSVGTGGIVKSLIAAHAAAASYKIGYIGNKGWVKVLADFSGSHGAATPLACLLVQSRLKDSPVTA